MIFLIFATLGLSMGSFINAAVWRSHEHINWLKKHSECDYCHHILQPLDLIPVFSWLILKGKCRYCHKSLHWQYPLTEIVTGLGFAMSWIFWPYGFNGLGVFEFVCWLVILSGFIGLSIFDFKWSTLPDKLVVAVTGVAIIDLFVTSIYSASSTHLLKGMIGAAIIAGLFYILFQISEGNWIGGGDVKLGICLGLLVGGPVNAIIVIFIASFSGSIASLPVLLKERTKNIKIPFGPFLMLATGIVFLFNKDLVSWYLHLLT